MQTEARLLEVTSGRIRRAPRVNGAVIDEFKMCVRIGAGPMDRETPNRRSFLLNSAHQRQQSASSL